MGIKFGEIDSSQILQNEYKIGVLEGILGWIIHNNSLISPSKKDIEEIKKTIVGELRKKYPKSGIKYKESENE